MSSMIQILTPFRIIGAFVIFVIRETGRMGIFLSEAVFWIPFPPYLFGRVIRQINFIGVKDNTRNPADRHLYRDGSCSADLFHLVRIWR